jgi:hypothetical protein
MASQSTDLIARIHADRLALALVGMDENRQTRHLADSIERLIDALMREGVPVERAARYAGDVTASVLERVRMAPMPGHA